MITLVLICAGAGIFLFGLVAGLATSFERNADAAKAMLRSRSRGCTRYYRILYLDPASLGGCPQLSFRTVPDRPVSKKPPNSSPSNTLK
jgi:hypothetical protein